MEDKQHLTLDRVSFYGRTLREYELMFDLDFSVSSCKRILDCPSGAASFPAEAAELGYRVIAVDPLYSRSLAELALIGQQDVDHVVERVKAASHDFIWEIFRSPEELRSNREQALRGFCADFERGRLEGRYLNARLPALPLPDASFDLVLSGHLLFTYSDFFSFDFHLDALRELSRVSSDEVRVFPLRGLDGKPYAKFTTLVEILRQDGLEVEIIPSNYEFVRGWNETLVLRKTMKADASH